MGDIEKQYDQEYFSFLMEKYGSVCKHIIDAFKQDYGREVVAFNLPFDDGNGKSWLFNFDVASCTLDIIGNHGPLSSIKETNFNYSQTYSPIKDRTLEKFAASMVLMTEEEKELFSLTTIDQSSASESTFGKIMGNGTTLIEFLESRGFKIDPVTFNKDFDVALRKELQG